MIIVWYTQVNGILSGQHILALKIKTENENIAATVHPLIQAIFENILTKFYD